MVVVKVKNPPHNFRFCGDDLKLLLLIDKVAIGRGAEPLPVRLPPPDDIFHLLAGVGDGHLVDEELELNFQPVVVVGKVDVVPNGDNPHPGVPQILQLHQSPTVPPGKPGKILHHQNVILMAHQPPAHGLIALPLLKGVAGAIPILIKGQRAPRKSLVYIIFDDSLLVLNGYIVPIQFVVHRNAAVTRNIKMLNHGAPPIQIISACILIITDNIV